MITITINGQVIQAQDGTTVLRAAETAGITIPTLCDHPDLTPYGGCRLCVVEVKGARLPTPACTLQVSEGLVVQTETPALVNARRQVLEALLWSYSDVGSPRKAPDTQFMRWVNHYGLSTDKPAHFIPRHPINSDPNPFIWVDLNKCILCTRCIRACAGVQGRFVWNMAGRGNQAQIVAGAETDLISARCESCGACVAYCPTGALDTKMSIDAGHPDRLVTTTCTYCGVGCQLDLNVLNGKVIRVTSNPNAPVNGNHLCVKGRFGYDFIHHPERLTKPKVRRYLLEGREKKSILPDQQSPAAPSSTVSNSGWDWVEVDWDTALDLTAQRLRETRDRYGSDSVGVLTSAKCLNEENFLMNKFARQVIGTNSIDHCARL